jgi:hypothetical protein
MSGPHPKLILSILPSQPQHEHRRRRQRERYRGKERAPQRRSGGRPASSSHGVDPAAERPDWGAATVDRASTSELLISALESRNGELLTSPRRPWRPVLRSSARACSLVCLWRQLTVPESHRPWRRCARARQSWRPCVWSSPSSLRPRRVSLPAARAAAPKAGVRGELPASVLGFFYVAIVVYWCCNNVLDMLQLFVFRM